MKPETENQTSQVPPGRAPSAGSASAFVCPVDLRDIARAHMQAALDDIKDGYIPEAVTELYIAANNLKAYMRKMPNDPVLRPGAPTQNAN